MKNVTVVFTFQFSIMASLYKTPIKNIGLALSSWHFSSIGASTYLCLHVQSAMLFTIQKERCEK